MQVLFDSAAAAALRALNLLRGAGSHPTIARAITATLSAHLVMTSLSAECASMTRAITRVERETTPYYFKNAAIVIRRAYQEMARESTTTDAQLAAINDAHWIVYKVRRELEEALQSRRSK